MTALNKAAQAMACVLLGIFLALLVLDGVDREAFRQQVQIRLVKHTDR